MKLVGIVGSIAPQSYNRQLMEYIAVHFHAQADIEILSIKDVPMFCEDHADTLSAPVQYLNDQIADADGVIIATPEHNHTTTAALKSVIEWLSYQVHPFHNKPVLIVGASYFTQGSSRAQLDLREILEAPGVGALVMPGNEFLLGNVKEAFDDEGMLKDQGTVKFLGTVMDQFLQWVRVLQPLSAPQKAQSAAQNQTIDQSADTGASASVKSDSNSQSDVPGRPQIIEDRSHPQIVNWSHGTINPQLSQQIAAIDGDDVDTNASASVNDDAGDDQVDTGASASVNQN